MTGPIPRVSRQKKARPEKQGEPLRNYMSVYLISGS